MTIQYLVVGILVLLAVFYIGNTVRNSFKGKQGCSKGCGCTLDEKQKMK